MPLYNYLCATHGEFDAWNSMSESANPAPCPTCQEGGRRMVSAPFLANMNSGNRKAHQVNERSAAEPKVGKLPNLNHEHGDHGHAQHGHGHGHAHHHGHGHSHGPSRPWMIGH